MTFTENILSLLSVRQFIFWFMISVKQLYLVTLSQQMPATEISLYLLHFLRLGKGMKGLARKAFWNKAHGSGTFLWCCPLKWRIHVCERGCSWCSVLSIVRFMCWLKRLSFTGNWSWAQTLETQTLKGCSLAVSYVWVLCSIEHSILEIRPQAVVTQRLHIGGNKTLALLLHRHWQKRGVVAGCCICNGTGLFICTALLFAGTPDLSSGWHRWDTHHAQYSEGKLKRSCIASQEGWSATTIRRR